MISGCYLCEAGPNPFPPGDDHDEWEEACEACDRRFWADPVFALLDGEPEAL